MSNATLAHEPISANNGSPANTSSAPRVSVIIPTLNEARNLPHVFARIPADVHEVIIVDGHSADDTIAVARELRPDVSIVMQTRRGKGNALACGFEEATGDIIAMIDADGSADPDEIPRFVQALLDGADFAKGSRYCEGAGSSDITPLRSLGNKVLSGMVVTSCTAPATRTCATATTFSGGAACPPSAWTPERPARIPTRSSGVTASRSRR